MSELGNKISGALRPDAQAFDEIRLYTLPRYKQSGMSGDEWRINCAVEFKRNGVVIHEEICGSNMDYAVQLLASKYIKAKDNGLGYFASEKDFCDQEGCHEKATVKYKKKFDYCREGHKSEITFGIRTRQFCDEHKTRGDCGLDDADNNYELLLAKHKGSEDQDD